MEGGRGEVRRKEGIYRKAKQDEQGRGSRMRGGGGLYGTLSEHALGV